MTIYHLHLISDATGETINTVARACLVQFEGVKTIEHVWSLVRTRGQMDKALTGIAESPGPVLFTLVNETQRGILVEGCRRLDVPCIPVLDPIIHRLASCFGVEISGLPGLQHALDAEYFHRMDAMNYALAHDDGQLQNDLDRADVVLVGVSRTSKTPTCIYLANRGIKAANVPIVPGCPLPDRLLQTRQALVIGLTTDPARLVQVRRNRMRMIAEGQDKTDYLDLDAVREEVSLARKYCRQHNWPIIDVTRRSIEETAATVMTLYAKHRGTGESPEESTNESTDDS
jgi:[pyruvate, water dikinase]-phosphate phosphotransferase / [pyruvate, water dikinase] kinase